MKTKTAMTEDQAEALGFAEASEQFKTQGSFSSGRTWDDNPKLNEAYDRGVNRAERDDKANQEHSPEDLAFQSLLGGNPIEIVFAFRGVCRERDKIKANAEKLAEALRDLSKAAIRNEVESELANQALADWQKGANSNE